MTAARFTLNGEPVVIPVASRDTTLLDAIRAHGLTGAKEGCAEGECGACTVIVVGESRGRTTFRAINSCLMLLPMAEGHDVYTVEGLADNGRLSEVQTAMAAAGGSQCGYCTPGFVMSLTAEHYRPERTGPCETAALSGNLCRCTGYRPIRDAAASLGAPDQGRLLQRLHLPAPTLGPVVSEGFSRPGSIDECLRELRLRPDAKVVAGASDVAVESNLHGRRFEHLVSLEAIEELRTVSRAADGGILIGAAVTLTELGEQWADAPDAVREWLTLFASLPVRNRATLGGNLVTASPIGDAAPLLLALDAHVHTARVAGGGASQDGAIERRTLALTSFFTGYRQTALRAGELLTGVAIPAPIPETLRFYKVAKRRLDDISTVAAAMSLDRDDTNTVRRARFCFGGVAATPIRLTEAESTVTGLNWNSEAVAIVQNVIDRTLTPRTDHRGSREYRLEVSKSLVDKFYEDTRR